VPAVHAGPVLIRVRYWRVSVGPEIAPLRPSGAASPDVPPLERALTSGLERARLARHYFRASLRDPRKAARRLSQIAERRLRRLQSSVAAVTTGAPAAGATADGNAQGRAIRYPGGRGG